jgi:putative ATP-binding cassette transporter
MQLDKKVQFDGDNFSTLDLSTGQRKRLAMVAMMENKPIYMFDEWASDQDQHYRKYFYETILPLFKKQGKTVIVISHDDRWFHVADQVIKLEYGQLAKS